MLYYLIFVAMCTWQGAFPISTFRKYTQARLLSKQYTPDDRKYMVSVLATMLLTYVEKAS
jgi:hypothetical protein